ncbi:hypothetical protein [Sulfuricurvum sp.]|uniref:hypothetical protein n=1 Tax=Sulfuricurvum sp. TaxID=2025608 RepID=UPI00262AC189|nr:hypothetical protein [Sulfuricurvum sp.]MDD2267643.1 hypothetical protein [Sulfuricurvum sp.]MDD2784771.1 hypothetical protein [Sulfuricurvum sp.]
MGETNWLDTLKGIGSGAFNWFSNGENLRGIGTLASGIGGAWSAIDQAKQAKALLNLQKGAYDDEKKRQQQAQLAIDGVNWSTPSTTTPRLTLGV